MKKEEDEAKSVIEAIAAHRKGGIRQFPKELRERIAGHARKRLSEGTKLSRVAREVDVDMMTLRSWLGIPRKERPRSFARVAVISDKPPAASTMRVVCPRGMVVEGLTLAEVAELLRALQ